MTESGPDVSKTTSTRLIPLILGLTDADSAARAAAAAEIFGLGAELARSAAENWFADNELARCFTLDKTHFPEVTVGVAVDPAAFTRIHIASGLQPLAQVPPDQDAIEFELEFPGGIRLDVLSTRQPGGPGAMSRHLQKFGESIQQVELLTQDVDRATELLYSHFNLPPIFPATRAGANGTRVNFFLVLAPNGNKVLIELVEAPPHS